MAYPAGLDGTSVNDLVCQVCREGGQDWLVQLDFFFESASAPKTGVILPRHHLFYPSGLDIPAHFDTFAPWKKLHQVGEMGGCPCYYPKSDFLSV